MKSIGELLFELSNLNIRLWTEDGRLRYKAPKGALTDDLRQQLAERKAEIISFLSIREKGDLSIQAVSREGELPLSFAQQRLWFLHQFDSSSAVYNIPVTLLLHGRLNVEALEKSINEIAARHEVLRTAFVSKNNGSPFQSILQSLRLSVPVTDLSQLPQEIQDKEVQRIAAQLAERPFILSEPPLIRTSLLKLHKTKHALFVVMHHIVSDGWSMGVFIHELASLYESSTLDLPVSLEPLQIQYADFAYQQRQWVEKPWLKEQLSYWKNQLCEIPPALILPLDHLRPPQQSFNGSALVFTVSKTLTDKLNELSRNSGASLFMTILGAFSLLMSRYSGQDDLIIGTPIANRNRREIEPLIGFFVNTLALRISVSGNPKFSEFLEQVRRTALDGYANQDVPFEQVIEAVKPERSMSHSPLFQVMFVLQNTPSEPLILPELKIEIMESERKTAKFEIMLSMEETQQGLKGEFEYNTDLFELSTITRMKNHFLNLLQAIVKKPEIPVFDLALLDETEWYQTVRKWNQTRLDYPKSPECLHQLFEMQASKTPNSIAVRQENKALTYKQLNQQVNQLARYLQDLGVRTGSIVGLAMERSIEMLTAMLGVLKAGAAYLPLEPSYPKERLRMMAEEAGLEIIVTMQSVESILPEIKKVCLDTDMHTISLYDMDNVATIAAGDNLAYVLYTSGSTGKPKAVMIAHRAIVNHMHWMISTFNFTKTDRILQKTPFSFDASVWEFYAPLISGGELIMAHPGGHQDPLYIINAIQKHKITIFQAVPTLLQVLVQEKGFSSCQNLRHVFSGGEVLSPSLAQGVMMTLPQGQLHNLYGPTETCIDSVFWTCRDLEAQRIPIGSPIANMRAYVLDSRLNPVPIGVAGELHLSGDGLASGYLHNSETTAEKFIPNPFYHPDHDPCTRLYKTGDSVRYDNDGRLEYAGRLDYQVKLRGYRIELGEIENVLKEHPAIKEVVAVAKEEHGLVAYVVTHEKLSSKEIQDFLKARLPEHMIPSFVVFLDALPLTSSGKIDRQALPEPSVTLKHEDYICPRTETEGILASVWAQLLGIERVGIDDNFFELGGHSLLAMQVMSRLRDVFQKEIPLRYLFESPTIRDLAQKIDTARADKRLLTVPAIERAERSDYMPLSFAQERLWFLEQLVPGNPFYNTPSAIRLKGMLNIQALKRALNTLVERHEALRTTFDTVDGTPRQVIRQYLNIGLPIVDLTGHKDAQTRARELAEEEAIKPFDLTQGPLIRAMLLWLETDESVLLITMHHIVSDVWSIGVLIHELSALYNGFAQRRDSGLSELSVQYADFALWQRKWLTGEILERQLAYWKKQLEGAPSVLELRSDYKRPKVHTFKGRSEEIVINPKLAKKLRKLSSDKGSSLYMTLLAAFGVLLSRYNRATDICIAAPIANRTLKEIEPLIGFFVNTLVLRVELEGNPTFVELMDSVRHMALEAYAHQDMPFEHLVEEFEPERDMSRNPLVQVSFAYQNVPMPDIELEGLRITPFEFEGGTVRFDLEVHLWDSKDGGLSGPFIYYADIFEPDTIKRFIKNYVTLLEAIADNPGRHISSLPILTESERSQILNNWSRVRKHYPVEQPIHVLFETQAAIRPDTIAVSFFGQTSEAYSLSYAEINSRSNQLSRYLRNIGVKPEVFVGLYMHRSVDLITAIVGILKAGGAYVPLEPIYPKDRLAYMMQDAGLSVLLTTSDMLEQLPETKIHVIAVDKLRTEIQKEPKTNPVYSVDPLHPAYVIYTSGSTGRPKGVVITHENVVRLFRAAKEWYNFSDKDVWTLFHSYAFDFSVWEIWGTLFYGGRLVIVSHMMSRSPEEFYELLSHEHVTVLNQTPSAFRQLIQAEERAEQMQLNLRYVIFGGEALDIQSLAPWFNRHGDQKPRLVNMYGITETTVHVTYRPLDTADLENASSVIGEAIPDLVCYILDSNLEPVPVGVPGELCVGGAGLARGYLGQPELTAERFVPNPFRESERLYRSGDLARFLKNGDIEYLGRIDHQVKIRGFRIELGEIESILTEHSGVAQAVVITREEQPEDKRIVAYIVPANDNSAETESQSQVTQLSEWEQVFENTYRSSAAKEDPTFDIVGWNSSYTGLTIPSEQMRQWVEFTVESIFELHPKRVLEIGCGTGMLLSRVAPHSEFYCGTDFSQLVLNKLEGIINDFPWRQKVKLICRTADNFDGLDSESFDTVVINSVVQYFPSVDYLTGVIEASVKLLIPEGGNIFIGDVRSLPLIESYYASVRFFQAADELPLGELKNWIKQDMMEENELIIDPLFFYALKYRIPEIQDVKIRLKKGDYHNELTRFRYDVVIQVGDSAASLVDISWKEWSEDKPTAKDIEQILEKEKTKILAFRHVPNSRIAQDNLILKWLHTGDDNETAGQFRKTLHLDSHAGIDPQQFWNLSSTLPYDVHICPSLASRDGSYDIVFQHHDTSQGSIPFWVKAVTKPLRTYTNNPLQRKINQQLTPLLREHLRKHLPEYMVPSVFMAMDSIPLTPNGKIDRRALPAPDASRRLIETNFVSARNPIEDKLTAIWSSVIGVEQIGIHDNFFALGGDSILSVQIVARAKTEGIKLTIKDLFEHQTIAELAAVAQTADMETESHDFFVSGPVLLTPIQHWFFAQDQIEQHHFNQSLLLETPSDVNLVYLQESLNHVVHHHDTLCHSFIKESGLWQQDAKGTKAEISLVVIDMPDTSQGETKLKLVQKAAELQASLKLQEAPLVRAAFFDFGSNSNGRLLIVIHHLVVDGVSWRILLEDLQTAYSQLSQNQPLTLSPKTTSYKTWAEKLKKYADSDTVNNELNNWLKLSQVQSPAIPVDFVCDEKDCNTAASSDVVSVSLDESMTRALLQDVPKTYNTRIEEALLTALVQTMDSWTGQPELLVDFEGHGREEIFEDVDISRTVGWFTTLFPMRLSLKNIFNPGDALKTIKEQLRQVPNRGIGYGILRYLSSDPETRKKLSSLPQAQISFNYLGQIDRFASESSLFKLAEEPRGPEQSPHTRRVYTIDINAIVTEGKLQMQWTYSTRIHRKTTIEYLTQTYINNLTSLITHCQSPEAGGFTPSDFPGAKISQGSLDKLLNKFR